MKKFYVYVIFDPHPGKNNVPVYVGKGTGNRAYVHLNKRTKHKNILLKSFLLKCMNDNLDVPVKIVKYFSSDVDAFKMEVSLIKKYGRRIIGTGTLYNQTRGGEGVKGIAGAEFSKAQSQRFKKTLEELWSDPEHHERMTKTNRKRQGSPTIRKALSKKAKGQWADPKFARLNRARLQRRNRSKKFRQYVAMKQRESWINNRPARMKAARNRIQPDMSGKNNPRYGVTLSRETRRKIGEAQRRYQARKRKERMRLARRNT